MRTVPTAFPKLTVARRHLWLSIATAIVLTLLALASPALGAEKDLAQKGQVIIRENCARCHAIGKTGESPNKEAPPFRVLSQSYPVEDLAESLAEGIMSGHPDMPVFVFNPHEVDAIIDYMKSIQVPEGSEPPQG